MNIVMKETILDMRINMHDDQRKKGKAPFGTRIENMIIIGSDVRLVFTFALVIEV